MYVGVRGGLRPAGRFRRTLQRDFGGISWRTFRTTFRRTFLENIPEDISEDISERILEEVPGGYFKIHSRRILEEIAAGNSRGHSGGRGLIVV